MTPTTAEILWVDDDPYFIQYARDILQMRNVTIREAGSVREAQDAMCAQLPDLVIIDMMMPSGEESESFASRGGFESGVVLAGWMKREFPQVPFVGCSARSDCERFFRLYGSGFIPKPVFRDQLADFIDQALGRKKPTLKAFIVHGHDEATKFELKNYIQNTLGWSEPTILHERPSLGRSIIEKFEDEAATASVVFVLLTPDDKLGADAELDTASGQARQNVIFEMGYFVGRLGRRSGRVLLLYKGPLVLPSDLYGVVYIDISNGVAAAGEVIRREISHIVLAR